MNNESENPVFERLSKNDRASLSRPTIHSVLLGVRPASTEDWEFEDSMAVEHALRSSGLDVIVSPSMLVNIPVLEQRIRDELDLAREVGWKNGMTARQLVEQYQNSDEGERPHGLLGFLLGFPVSAIRGFKRREELEQNGVPWDVQNFFDPKRLPELMHAVKNEHDQKILQQMVSDAKALPKRSWEFGPDRPDWADEEALIDRYRPEIVRLYQKYWKLSQTDAEGLAFATSVDILGPDGKPAISFAVFGKNGSKEPDVLDLQRRFAEAFLNEKKNKKNS